MRRVHLAAGIAGYVWAAPCAVVASVYILFQISGDGETNWIEGVQLLSVYVILGILFFYLPEAVAH